MNAIIRIFEFHTMVKSNEFLEGLSLFVTLPFSVAFYHVISLRGITIMSNRGLHCLI
jgi:hypothetical protein